MYCLKYLKILRIFNTYVTYVTQVETYVKHFTIISEQLCDTYLK